MKGEKNILPGILFAILVSSAYTASFTVTDISEFQNALNAAAENGEDDTIKVRKGTYDVITPLNYWSSENHSLYIKGEEPVSLDGGNSTRIMELITTSNNGHIFIEGITFRKGRGDYGGALYAETNSAEIVLRDCDFNGNTAGYVGGGANLYSITGYITVTNCSFIENSSPNESGYPYGTAGGLFIQTEGNDTKLRVIDCRFEDNTCERDAAGAMLYPLGNGASIRVESSTFKNNHAGEFGGGCWIRAPGGDTRVEYINNTITDNSTTRAGSGAGTYIEIVSGEIEFSDNSHRGNSSVWQGGGLWVEQGSGNLRIKKSTFTNNSSLQNGGGANIFLENGKAEIERNIFNRNSSSESGGGLCLSTTKGTLNIFNNTFYSNSALDGGDIYLYFDEPSAFSDLYNNILWKSSHPPIAFSGEREVTARYSDIEGGEGEEWFGPGCIDKEPLFNDPNNGDFHLTWDNFPVEDETKSPCIDAGDPSSPPDPDGTRADMGAFYFNQSTGVNENSSQNLLTLPNPCYYQATIRYSISKPYNVKIQIYGITGQLLETLVNDYRPAGQYTVTWDTKDVSSGIYFCRLEVQNHRVIRKLILLR